MINIGDLIAYLRLKDEMTPELENAINTVNGLREAGGMTSYQLTLLGRGLREAGTLATAAFTVPIVGAAAAVVKFGGDFEEEMSKSVALAGVTQAELEGVKNHILELAPTVGIGPVPLAKAMYAVSSTVSDTKVAMDILDRSARLSAAGMGEVEVVARGMTTIINAYGAGQMTAARAADVFTRAIRDGGAEAQSLAPVLANVVPFAAKLGVSIEQVGANFATLTKLGVPAGEAVTQLNSVFAALTRETPRGAEALKSVGTSYQELKERIRGPEGLAAVIQDLSAKFKNNDSGLFAVLGRLEALKNVMGTTGEMTATYTKEVQRMYEATGDADAAFKVATENFNFLWKQVVVQLEVVAVTLSRDVLPIFKEFLVIVRDDIVPIIKLLVEGFRMMPEWMQKSVIGFLALLAAVGPVLIFFGQLILSIGNISRAFGFLTTSAAWKAFMTFITGMTFTGVITALGLVALAIISIGAAWKISHTEFMQNINEWMVTSESWAATLMRYASGLGHLDPAIMRAQIAAAKASQTDREHKEVLDQKLQVLQSLIQPMAAHTAATNDQKGATQTLLEQVAALSSEQRESIEVFKMQGLTVKQISKETGITTEVIGVYLRQLARSKADIKGVVQAQQELYGSFEQVSTSDKKLILDLHELGVSAEKIAKAWDLNVISVKNVIQEYDTLQKYANRQAKINEQEIETFKKLQQEYADTANTVGKDLITAYVNFTNKRKEMGLSSTQAEIERINREEAEWKAFYTNISADFIAKNKFQYEQAGKAAEEYFQHLRDLQNLTYDTLGERLRSHGVLTIEENKKLANDARVTYEQMKQSGEYTLEQMYEVWKEHRDKVKALGGEVEKNWEMTFFAIKKNLKEVFEDIPDIFMKSFTGGGSLLGAIKAIGVDLANAVLEPMLENLTKMEKRAISVASTASAALGAKAGGSLGAAIAGTASSIGGAAVAATAWGTSMAAAGVGGAIALGAVTFGIGAAAAGLVGLAMKWFNHKKMVEENTKAIYDFQKQIWETLTPQQAAEAGGESWKATVIGVRDAYLATGRTAEDALRDVKAMWDSTTHSAEETAAAMARINQAFAEQKERAEFLKDVQKQYDDIIARLDDFIVLSPEVEAGLKAALDAATPLEYKAALDQINSALDAQAEQQRILKDAMSEYGIKWTDLGKAAQSAHIAEETARITKQFEALLNAGADVNFVMRKMGPNIQEIVAAARKSGAEIPESFRRVIQTAMDAGEIFDENKNQIKDMKDLGVNFGDTVETKMKNAVDSMKEAIDRLIELLRNLPPVTIDIKGRYTPPDNMPTGGYDPGDGNTSPSVLPGRSYTGSGSSFSPNPTVNRTSGSSRGETKVVINLEGREIAYAIVPHLPDAVQDFG